MQKRIVLIFFPNVWLKYSTCFYLICCCKKKIKCKAKDRKRTTFSFCEVAGISSCSSSSSSSSLSTAAGAAGSGGEEITAAIAATAGASRDSSLSCAWKIRHYSKMRVEYYQAMFVVFLTLWLNVNNEYCRQTWGIEGIKLPFGSYPWASSRIFLSSLSWKML